MATAAQRCGWGGSRRQTSEPTNRNRIQGRCGGTTRLRTGTSNSQTETTAVYPAALGGRISVLPWEISSCLRATGAGGRRRPPTQEEKSAEAIVAQTIGRRAEFD